jgi:alpha-L-fucosidase
MLVTTLTAFALARPQQPPAPAPVAPPPALAPGQADRDERMGWWRQARFGLFVHWGLYSAAGGAWRGKVYPQHYAEWIQHWAAVPCADYASAMKPRFQPAPGFAASWAQLARDAGMRYAVMTAKHHDGFTLFRSRQPYSLDNPVTGGTNISPPERDLAREFADAMRAVGLRPGFYYSLLDWQHPDAYEMALPAYAKPTRQRDHAVYVDYVRAHVEELLTGYGDLATIWFDYSDAQRQGEAWGASALLELLRRKQPRILVNNRLYEGLENKLGDYGTPEKYVPPTGLPGMDWEVNHTLNESYGFSAHDTKWKDTTAVVRLLVDVVSKGGNLLLNIGPDATGQVPAPAQQALRGVGTWLRTHGEAIYGTTASPFAKLPWGRATQQGEVLYLLVFDWPTDGRLRLPMRASIAAASLLGSTASVGVTSTAAGLELALPAAAVDPACSVIKLRRAGDWALLPFAVAASPDGTFVLSPHDATLHGPQLRVEQVGVVGEVCYNLGYWLDAAAFATWPLVVERAARYRVVAELACQDASAGAACSLGCAAGKLSFRVVGTGGWQDYRSVDLGTLDLPAGRHEIELRAVDKPGEAVLNLRALRLLPQ